MDPDLSSLPNLTLVLRPDLVVHADWGSDPKKRWMCVAVRDWHGRFQVEAPEPVGPLSRFWSSLRDRSPGPRILVGFDFPIGLPVEYAQRAGFPTFADALEAFGSGDWADFYSVAETPSEISVKRPFYPFRPGGTERAHLVDGLGMAEMHQLLRTCERRTQARAAASPLFWTLGGKQVGRAAIVGWRDVLGPALARGELLLWPFDGDLQELLRSGKPIALETYPAEACTHLGCSPPGVTWAKTSQAGRAEQASALLRWSALRRISLSPELQSQLRDGFGPDKGAEDPFDATVGLLSMLEVALGHRPEGAPSSPVVRSIEGWIFGQRDDAPLSFGL